ncbi:hypothetical protein BDV06DRAFT_768 [Aspergillus oleicola]
MPMPSSPLLQASYLAMDTPKLRYLLEILHEESSFHSTVSACPRFVILAHWQSVLSLTDFPKLPRHSLRNRLALALNGSSGAQNRHQEIHRNQKRRSDTANKFQLQGQIA